MNDDKVVNKEEEATLPAESAPVEPKPEVTETEAQAEETKTEEEVPKKSAEGRIRELNAKANTAEQEAKAEKARAESLKAQLEAFTGGITPQTGEPSYTPQIEAGQEVSPDQYKADVYKTADSLVNLRLEQERIINRINREANESMQRHSELNPDSENFKKNLSDTVTKAVIAFAKGNPTGSINKFVDELMVPYKEAVNKEVGEQTENLAKQVSETALRPTNVKQEEKKFDDLSIAEMEKKLGIVY